MTAKPGVSLIATVYNERQTIDRLLESIMAQSRRPDEIVFCDGGSTDGTVEHLRRRLLDWEESPPFKILVEAGANISRGRNLAIGAAEGPIIAVTDAGVRLDEHWLKSLVEPWDAEGDQTVDDEAEGDQTVDDQAEGLEKVPAVAGFFVPDVDGVFQTAMAATVLPLEEDIDPQKFLPSSRSVAFLKSTWRAAGEYPEWLDYCEDLIFDLNVNRRAGGFAWQPDAKVYFRPREDLGSFWRQYYLYARGDGKADLWRKRHALRYFVYLVLVPALVGHALWGKFARPLGVVGLLIGLIAYMRRPWARVPMVGENLALDEIFRAMLWVPVIRVVGDLAKMVGYPVGLWWRYTNRKRLEPGPTEETAPLHDPAD